MSFATDIADDFADIVDGLSSVTLRDRCGHFKATVESCLRRAVTVSEAAKSNGRYTSSDTVFHFPVSEATGTNTPLPGWKISDTDGLWTILEAAKQTLGARWRCVCRNLAIACGLDQRLTLQVATWTKNAAGVQEATWSDVSKNLLGKFQLLSADNATDHGLRNQPRAAAVYLDEQVLVSSDHRFIGPRGEILNVTGWEDADAIDALFKVNCEVSVWPLS